VVGSAEAAVQEHPLRERRWAQLMVALYRCGRQAEALSAFQRLRRHLADELGLDPSQELMGLERSVLTQDPGLDWSAVDSPAVQLPGAAPLPTIEDASPPLPERLAIPPSVGFVGRRPELNHLSERFKTVATDGGQRVVLISGEPGIGKTALVAQLARALHREGALVLYGRCEDDIGIPYQPFAEALGYWATRAPPQTVAAAVAEHGAELTRLVPSLAQRGIASGATRSTDPESERYLLYAMVVALLAELSANNPLMLILDDLHWADKPTLLMLRHLAGTSAPMRLLVVGTYRDSDLPAAHPLVETLAALRRESVVDRLALPGWADVDVLSVLESGAGQQLGPAGVGLGQALRRETDGNPFFVIELLRHLAETGWLYRDQAEGGLAQRQLGDAGLPQSVREVVGQRVARLGQPAGAALSAAAVIGQQFDVELLSVLTGRVEDELLDVLDMAAAAGLVQETPGRVGSYGFAHALYQHTLYGDLGATRVAHMHRRVGEALEELCGPDPGVRLGELAHHWAKATNAGNEGKAVDYARRAGEAALTALAPDEAVRWFAQALAFYPQVPAPDDGLRCDLLIGLGDAQRQSGDPVFRETLLEAAHLARERGDRDRLVRAALANNRGLFSQAGVIDTDRIAVLQAALSATEGDSRERALVLGTLATELTTSPDWRGRMAIAREAQAMARRLGDLATLVRVLCLTYFPLWVPETLPERLASTAEAVTLAEDLGDPLVRFFTSYTRTFVSLDAAEIDQLDLELETCHRLAEQLGQPHMRWVSMMYRSWRSLHDGQVDLAETQANDALQIATDSGMPDGLAVYAVQLLDIRRHQGRLQEMEQLFAQAAEDTPGLPALRALLAKVHSELQHNDEARLLLDAAAASGFADLTYDSTWLWGMTCYAEACSRLGEIDVADALYRNLEPWSSQFANSGPIVNYGAVALYLAMLATVLRRFDDAEVRFAQAMDIHQRLRAPFWVARTEVEWARMCATRGTEGDHRRATDLLEQATHSASVHGFAGIAREVSDIAS
jgi:tetratricopeptide (TPR) repeat protein